MKTAPRTIARSSALRLVSRLIQPKKIGLGAPMKPRRKYEAILRPSGMFCVTAKRQAVSRAGASEGAREWTHPNSQADNGEEADSLDEGDHPPDVPQTSKTSAR